MKNYNRYITSLFYSVLTMVTVSHLNIQNPIEQLFAIIIDLILTGIFAYSINKIGTIYQEITKSDKELR